MSETLEARRARLAALEARDWVHTGCTQCGAGGVVCAPGQEAGALCGGCRLQETSLATAIQRLPAVAPPPMVVSGSGKILAQDGAEAVPVAPERTCPVFVYGSGVNGCGHDMPGPVRDLAGEALMRGWSVQRGHSRGVRSGASAVAELWSVRFRRGTWQGYAVRVGDAWKSVCIAGAALPPFLALGVTDLREWLAEPERCSGAAWIGEARRRQAAAELHKKLVRCPGPPRCVVAGPWTVDGAAPAALDHTHRGDGAIVKKVSRKEAAAGL